MRRNRIDASGRALERIVHALAREQAVGPRRIEAVLVRAARNDDDRDAAEAQALIGVALRDPLDVEARLRAERAHHLIGSRDVEHADRDPIRRLVAERDAEPDREQDREAEDPEQDARLAQELAEAREEELDERIAAAHRRAA